MTATEQVRADLALRMSNFPLIEPAPFLLVKVSNDNANLLAREAGKQKARHFTGQPITQWGAL